MTALFTAREFAATPASVSAARRFLISTLGAGPGEDLLWAAELLVSELAANAVLHACTPFSVQLRELADGVLRIEVTDGARRSPHVRRYGPESTTGRGMALVAELSCAWGVEMQPEGKMVWCELAPQTDGPRGRRVTGKEDSADFDLDHFLGDEDVDAFGDKPDGGGRAPGGSGDPEQRLRSAGEERKTA